MSKESPYFFSALPEARGFGGRHQQSRIDWGNGNDYDEVRIIRSFVQDDVPGGVVDRDLPASNQTHSPFPDHENPLWTADVLSLLPLPWTHRNFVTAQVGVNRHQSRNHRYLLISRR